LIGGWKAEKGMMEYWNIGMMYWNDVEDKKQKPFKPIIPPFHYSSPIGAKPLSSSLVITPNREYDT
jgi:hypothetical protein